MIVQTALFWCLFWACGSKCIVQTALFWCLFWSRGFKCIYCANRAVLVPVLEPGFQIYCANRAVLVPVLVPGLQMYCANSAVLVPVLEPGLQMTLYCGKCTLGSVLTDVILTGGLLDAFWTYVQFASVSQVASRGGHVFLFWTCFGLEFGADIPEHVPSEPVDVAGKSQGRKKAESTFNRHRPRSAKGKASGKRSRRSTGTLDAFAF